MSEKLSASHAHIVLLYVRRVEYSGSARYALWIMTEIAIIGSDVQEVIGSAIAISLLTHGWVPLWAGTLITAVDSFLILFIERLGIRHLEAVFGVLISSMAASFAVMYVWAGVPTGEVIKGEQTHV
jgi:natural resistance-associated macrophage protein 2